MLNDNYEFVETLFNNLQEYNENKYNIAKICTDSSNIIDYILKDIVDVILLDLNMPNVDGFEILDIIKKNNIKSKVIVISGDTSCILRLIKEKYNNFVLKLFIKPFEVTELIEELNFLYNETNVVIKNEDIEMLLNNFNFNKASVGYEYIKQCLTICIKKKYKYVPNMDLLYDNLSKENNLGVSKSIKWDIYKTIDNMRKNTDKNILKQYFNFIPSAKTFLNKILSIYFSN